MYTRSSVKSFAALAASIILAVVAQAGLPPPTTTYTTEFTGTNDPLNAFLVGRIEVVWSTSVAANNPVAAADLSSLSVSFYNTSNSLVYTDYAIVGGVVQPIGGVARTFSDIVFDATSGVSIGALDNDLEQVQFGASIGATYNLYSSTSVDGPVINLARYTNGTFASDATFHLTGQATTSGAVPEPSSAAALAGLAGLGFAASRRRRT